MPSGRPSWSGIFVPKALRLFGLLFAIPEQSSCFLLFLDLDDFGFILRTFLMTPPVFLSWGRSVPSMLDLGENHCPSARLLSAVLLHLL